MILLSVCACGPSNSLAESPLIGLTNEDAAYQLGSLEQIDQQWDDSMSPALLEYMTQARVPFLRQRSLEILSKRTGQNFGYDVNAWFAWVWAQEFELPPQYAEFKSRLYAQIDERFADYFASSRQSDIRLDEIRWGGVRQNGIPPLRSPKMIAAEEAEYLDDSNVIFGLVVNGDARAYPKRILAWHEMFTDDVGGVAVTGVYCTLCGSMILYDSVVDETHHTLGTSGFLFRSNKLMFDEKTSSLWNTLWGTPAVGPLVDKGIRLPRRSVVTTTWGEWRRRHPETTVLSLDTGHRRDYGEGIAYQEYFATDELMFNSSQHDQRLPNKAEILGLVFNDTRPLAIAAEYGTKQSLLHEQMGELRLVVLTDRSGAMRAYESGDIRFESWDQDKTLVDNNGTRWALKEDKLVSETGETLSRLPSHNAFWFGWYGAYTNTRLLH